MKIKSINLVIILSIIILTGCAANEVKKVTLPTGKTGFFITCDGGFSDLTTCYESARKACNGDYTISDKSETSTATQYGPIERRNMIVDCKK